MNMYEIRNFYGEEWVKYEDVKHILKQTCPTCGSNNIIYTEAACNVCDEYFSPNDELSEKQK
uniref:Uncharacterized protein n=1 Tax=viral metagenome TaxID=1070528 RepID=A0A6M3MFB1_9ZZZZ